MKTWSASWLLSALVAAIFAKTGVANINSEFATLRSAVDLYSQRRRGGFGSGGLPESVGAA
jgi:hypothetical protein